jgi:uncharacterized protein YbcI
VVGTVARDLWLPVPGGHLSAPLRRGEQLTNISNALGRLHKEYYGKGPTQAKTFFVDDTVMCVLRGGFTAIERTLIESGQESPVREIRRSFQQAMRDRFTEVIEGSLDRKVIAYMSQVHAETEISIEVFLLKPEEENDEEEGVETPAGQRGGESESKETTR